MEIKYDFFKNASSKMKREGKMKNAGIKYRSNVTRAITGVM